MQFDTHTTAAESTHQLGSLMREVLYALVPGTLIMIWFFGWGMLSNLVLSIGFAILFEAIMLKMRQRPIKPFISDYSAVVTAWLLALTMPPFAPWWLLAVAIFFAIVIAKHLYGGLGYNPFNPAMIGYAVALISFPVEMVQWPTPTAMSFEAITLSQTFQYVFSGMAAEQWDAITSATVLDVMKTELRMGQDISSIEQSSIFGQFAASGWEWVSIAYLAGGLWLVYRNIITWHIPVSLLGTLGVISAILWLWNPESYASPVFHLLAGGAMLGAFFIATDPVSASTTPLGKIIYAAGIAFIIYVIRVFGSGYPDGVAFGVIIMNMAVPLIDYYTKPRVFGESKSHE